MVALAGDPPAPLTAPCPIELSWIRARLAPTLRHREAASAKPQAAVALILRGDEGTPSRAGARGGTELLLIRRSDRPSDPWSGHMALPGGRRDPADADLLHTALRETFEEVGLDLESHGALIGNLPPLPAIARGRPVGMTITPLVFELTQGVTLRESQDEVAETLWVRLDDLRSGQLNTRVDPEIHGLPSHLELPAWAVQGRLVWGLTHRMISTLFELLELSHRAPMSRWE